MKDIILIYNPKAGDTYFRFSLDRFIEIFSEKKYEIRVFRSREPGDMALYLKECNLAMTEAIFVAGGDGTVNEVVNAMMEIRSSIPIGVIPAGTDNDFAKTLGFSDDLEENLQILKEMNQMPVDVGNVNGRYFVNICSAGTLASLTNVSNEMKNLFGRWAYYAKGVSAITKYHKMDLRIEADGTVYEGRFALFMLINSRIRRKSNDLFLEELSDGKYDMVAVKVEGIANVARVLMKVIRKEPIKEKDILYLRGSHFIISCADDHQQIKTEIDGDSGPQLPMEVSIEEGALNFFVRK